MSANLPHKYPLSSPPIGIAALVLATGAAIVTIIPYVAGLFLIFL